MRFFQFRPLIKEAFDVVSKDQEVPFRKSTVTDPHIQQVVQKISNETGVPVADLLKVMAEDMERMEEVGKFSPMLYNTLIMNNAENAAFDLISKSTHPVDYKNATFDLGIFSELIEKIQEDHSETFGGGGRGLESPGQHERIYDIKPILVPSKSKEIEAMGFNTVTTAAATDNGEFIFNKPFMEQLLYYGAAVDIQPIGTKYVCNGGNIPNNYCYIEFLIMHELMHYAWADFAAGRKYPQFKHTVHNWASDLRSNYWLVKSGYTQLPMGLFSKDLNFDQPATNNYKKLVTIVDRELKKLPRQLQAWIEGKDKGGDHPPGPKVPQEPWEPEVGEVVIHNKQGTFGRITKILPDGEYETTPISIDEVEKIYPGIKVG
jgi:hypothetical protein